MVRDGDAIARLFTELGAHGCARGWRERQLRRQAPVTATQVASFDHANGRRIARAAAAAVARVQAAMALLQGQAPEHLLAAGRLRLEHPHVSLEQLATLADPPMTKDAVAGKLRRLLALADRCAACLNLPSTQAAVTVELLDAADQERRTSQSAARYPQVSARRSGYRWSLTSGRQPGWLREAETNGLSMPALDSPAERAAGLGWLPRAGEW